MNYIRKLTLAKRIEYRYTRLTDVASFSQAVRFGEAAYYMMNPETGGGWCIAVLVPHTIGSLPPCLESRSHVVCGIS